MVRIGRVKRPDKTRRKSRGAQKKAMPTSTAEFRLQGGKIESGFYSGPHPSSFLFWTDPPDPDLDFAPFYQRAVSGDLGALVDFYRRHGLNPGAAFYQCIGYLAARGSAEETKETVQKIISINRRGGPHRSSSAKNESVREWERRLFPQTKSAAKWLHQRRQTENAQGLIPLNREQLWLQYLEDNLRLATPGIRQHIESGYEALEPAQPIYRTSTLGRSTPKNPQPLLLTPGEKRARKRSIRDHATTIALANGVIPKDLFLELAQTAPNPISPSVAVRRLARKLVF